MRTVRTLRIVIASLLTAGALLAGGVVAQHDMSANALKIVLAGPVPCCNGQPTPTTGT